MRDGAVCGWHVNWYVNFCQAGLAANARIGRNPRRERELKRELKHSPHLANLSSHPPGRPTHMIPVARNSIPVVQALESRFLAAGTAGPAEPLQAAPGGGHDLAVTLGRCTSPA